MLKKLFATSFIFLSLFASVHARSGLDNIKHTVIIILENTEAITAEKQPYLKKIKSKGAYLAQYYAVAHPSQPNYLALVGGSIFDVSTDENVNINATQIATLLKAKNKSWKIYAEDYPGNCFLGEMSGNYVRKHVPLLSFTDIQNDKTECKKIVSGKAFFRDLAANALPDFALYIPNLKNDGHDTGVAFADKWLARRFAKVLANKKRLQDTLFIITFDEDNYMDNNRVYTLLLGAGVKPGFTSRQRYSHYGLLHTLENIYGLGNLGRLDATEPAITDVWKDS